MTPSVRVCVCVCIYQPAACWLSLALDGQPLSLPADGCSCRLFSATVGVSPGSGAVGRRAGLSDLHGRYSGPLWRVDHHLSLLVVDADVGLVRGSLLWMLVPAAKRRHSAAKLPPSFACGLWIFYHEGPMEMIMPWSLTRSHTLKKTMWRELLPIFPLTFK